MLRENMGILGWVFFWGAGIFVLLALLQFAGLRLLPTWLTLQRKAYVASHQYIEAKRSEIASLMASYEENNCALEPVPVCKAMIYRIRAAAEKIPPEALPPNVYAILGR